MKNSITLALCLLVSLAMSKAFACSTKEGKPIIKISIGTKATSLKLHLANLQEQQTSIALNNRRGETIYKKEVSKQRAFAKFLDLSQLAEGKYLLEISNAAISVQQPILVQKTGITILTKQRKQQIAPRIEFEDNAVSLQLQDSRMKSVKVAILNGSSLVYSTKEILSTNITKRYKLEKLYPDDYLFRVTIDGKNYYKDIAIR